MRYAPGIVPQDSKDAHRFLQSELIRIASSLNAVADGHLDLSTSEPSKPRDGDIRYADGTLWNPSDGEGIYAYFGGEWHTMASRHAHAQISSNQDHVPPNTSEFQIVTNQEDYMTNVSHSAGTITIQEHGEYLIIAGGQVGKVSGSSLVITNLWMKKNDVVIPNTNVRTGFRNDETVPLVTSLTARFAPGDEIKFFMSVSTTGGSPGLYYTDAGVAPATPSIIISITS